MAAIRLQRGQSESVAFADSNPSSPAVTATYTLSFFVPGVLGQAAVLEVGITSGDPHPDNPFLYARSYRVTTAGDGAGSLVEWTFSSEQRSGGTLPTFDPIADLDAYSYSLGFEEREYEIPTARTISVLQPPPTGSPVGATPVQASAWGDTDKARTRTTLTRVSLRTAANSVSLGLGGTDKAADLADVLAISANANKIVTIGGQEWLLRIDRFQQATTPLNGSFALARWDIEYTLLYDPGDRGDNTGLVEYLPKNALFAWTQGDGSSSLSRGYALPWVLSPYANGPAGRFQRPPFSEVFAVPDEFGVPDPGNPLPIRDVAPQFGARALYDTTAINFFNLPGVP